MRKRSEVRLRRTKSSGPAWPVAPSRPRTSSCETAWRRRSWRALPRKPHPPRRCHYLPGSVVPRDGYDRRYLSTRQPCRLPASRRRLSRVSIRCRRVPPAPARRRPRADIPPAAAACNHPGASRTSGRSIQTASWPPRGQSGHARRAGGMQRTSRLGPFRDPALGHGDQPLDKGPDLLRLRNGGLDLLMANQSLGLVPKQRVRCSVVRPNFRCATR